MSKKSSAHEIRLKRVYDLPANSDGIRVLVDRLWPRGVRKADAAVDLWMKDIAPSPALRIWFGHDPKRWSKFRTQYRKELQDHIDLRDELVALAKEKPVTLVYGARDTEHTHALVIKEFLDGGAKE